MKAKKIADVRSDVPLNDWVPKAWLTRSIWPQACYGHFHLEQDFFLEFMNPWSPKKQTIPVYLITRVKNFLEKLSRTRFLTGFEIPALFSPATRHGAAGKGANSKVRWLKKWTCHILVREPFSTYHGVTKIVFLNAVLLSFPLYFEAWFSFER